MEIDLSIFQKSQQQPEVKRIEPEVPAESAPAAEENIAPQVPKESVVDFSSPVKVLGKVDLDAVGKKPKVKSKAGKESEEEKEGQQSTEISKKKPEAIVAKKAEDVTSVEQEADAESTKVEKLEPQIKKLSGPTVVGKIELPVKKKKAENEKSDDNKRKRKRITKVDVERQARTASGQRLSLIHI